MAKSIEIKQILELKESKISQNAMEKNFHISKKTSKRVLEKAKELNVSFSDVYRLAQYF